MSTFNPFKAAQPKREPHVWEALFSLIVLITGIGLAIIVYETDPHVPMLIGMFMAAFMGHRAGYSWAEIESGMLDGVRNSLQAIVIISIIGVLIGVWILSGVVPTIIFYGLKILSPAVFLPATVLICSITSLATGTSWGTAGTIGVALIGIGQGLGFPLYIVAGAVLSGSYFGDKMSPLSDTTNLAPAMAGTDLYTHIRHMVYTTSVSYSLALIMYVIVGIYIGGADGSDTAQVDLIVSGIAQKFDLNPLLLLPPLVVMGLAVRKTAAIPGIGAGVLAGALLGMWLQGNTFGEILRVGYNGYVSETGVATVDALLSKGGLKAMLYAISIAIVALMYGGVMERTNQLKVIVGLLLRRVTSSGGLISSTIFSAIGANLLLCDQYMAVVVSARTYADSYRERGLDARNLSRAVEDSATVTGCLIPWHTGGAYMSATLGVATIAYLPFAFFNWLSPLVSLIYGIFNITIVPLKDSSELQAEEP